MNKKLNFENFIWYDRKDFIVYKLSILNIVKPPVRIFGDLPNTKMNSSDSVIVMNELLSGTKKLVDNRWRFNNIIKIFKWHWRRLRLEGKTSTREAILLILQDAHNFFSKLNKDEQLDDKESYVFYEIVTNVFLSRERILNLKNKKLDEYIQFNFYKIH